jgi:hypothetical protein
MLRYCRSLGHHCNRLAIFRVIIHMIHRYRTIPAGGFFRSLDAIHVASTVTSTNNFVYWITASLHTSRSLMPSVHPPIVAGASLMSTLADVTDV